MMKASAPTTLKHGSRVWARFAFAGAPEDDVRVRYKHDLPSWQSARHDNERRAVRLFARSQSSRAVVSRVALVAGRGVRVYAERLHVYAVAIVKVADRRRLLAEHSVFLGQFATRASSVGGCVVVVAAQDHSAPSPEEHNYYYS